MRGLALAIATGGYVGFLPVVPGTFGSALGLVLFVGLRSVAPPAADLLVAGLLFVIGLWAANIAERELGGKDPAPIVIDEVLGMLLTLAWLPASMPLIVAGFVAFRILDVLKPFPARRLEDAPGGLGVMLDDAMAGVYANIALRVLMLLPPAWFV
jgi:phosphatidylglycerophosphatase A